ncbi:MAG TPA: DUF4383 domain-containing protein [Pseudonocardia sp.]|jgi:hypothetical protein|uniref:DUF4383 domain-containing protein n=1 Tax=Pseudonocardia sp. TaxID=60912 RepID=UPI002F40E64B
MTASQDTGGGLDVVWGIKSHTDLDSLPKKFALLAGLAYLVGGVIGFFFTGFHNFTENTGISLFGIFHLTPFHNIIHIGVGALWLIAAFTLTRVATEGVNLAVGGVYVLAAVLGYLGSLTFIGVMPGFGDADFYLHLVTGVASLVFAGLIPLPDHSRRSHA